ncbi:MAG: SMP-30/gluconolactonase/LRE family protein [Planctomycetales bacterium]|nr:SMP-30/gluconolactonase/LRE family protein [Planctomycetales bacterium]
MNDLRIMKSLSVLPVFLLFGSIGIATAQEWPANLKIEGKVAFTEGPAWHAESESVFFTDIENNRIMRRMKDGSLQVYRQPSGKANGLVFDQQGRLYACEGGDKRVTRTELDGTITVLTDRFEGHRYNSPNDLALAPDGSIYFTDPRYGSRDDMELEVEGVYYVSRRGKITRVIDDMVRPNGIALSLDRKTLYAVDNGAQTIKQYGVNDDGSLANGSLFFDMGKECGGGGDGMTIDSRGNIYCAGAGAVWAWNPNGELLAKITPPEGPANCVFGGADNRTLFITARTGFYSVTMNVAGGR